MEILNIEFKVKCSNPGEAERLLLQQDPVYVGEDLQVDTYFEVPTGRLKLREGNIENALIYYERSNIAGSKSSAVSLYTHLPGSTLKELLSKALGIKVVVEKLRRIYFIENVKFHFDSVKNLGTFMEVEAIDKDGSVGPEKLQKQCDHFASMFKISREDFLAVSYSDMLLEQKD